MNIRKYLLLSLSFLLSAGYLSAQQNSKVEENYEEIISYQLDSLVNNWYVNKAYLSANANYPSENQKSIEFPDSVYMARIGKLNSTITLPYNSIIRNHIHVYTSLKQDRFRVMIGQADYYFPMIEDIFESYGLPVELKYMAVIESALNPNAVSRVGATGLWQFMYSTGKMYGLKVNSLVDDRRDPVKATHAAARYIKDLYNIYGDWILVIAAYNCGPGNVNKAIKRSGNKKDYWEIYYRLPRETRGYIPQFVAALYAMNYYPEHDIQPIAIEYPVATDTVRVNYDIHLGQIAEVLQISLGELKALNPQYRTGMVPGKSQTSAITLPVAHLSDFIAQLDSITGYKTDHFISASVKATDPSVSKYMPPQISGKTRLNYKVKSGDNLGYIASWYGVGLSDLRYWNNIYKNTIKVGQNLVIYVEPSRSEYYSAINNMSFEAKQKMVGKQVPENQNVSASSSVQTGDYEYYTVRTGDTVWDIAKKFDNVSATDILKLNNLSDAGRIQVGQKLKIRRKS